MADFDPEFSYDDPDVPKGEDADKYTRCAPQRCSAHRIPSSGTRRAGGTHCRRRTERRLSEVVPVYAASDQHVCGVDMSLKNVQTIVT